MLDLDPVKRRQLGTGMLLMGLVFILLAGVIFGGNYLRRNSVIKEELANAQECDIRLRTLGAENVLRPDENTIMTTWKGVDEGLSRLGDSSAAALACPGWVMDSFCMGLACTVPGATMTLRKAQ